MSDQQYRLTLTRQQLVAIGKALEACFRMGIGQPADAMSYCRRANGDAAICGWDEVKDVELVVKRKMGLRHNESWGVGKFSDLDALYEMYKSIERFLSWEKAVADGVVPSMDAPRKWPAMMGCNFDDPLRLTGEPMILVEKING